MQARKAKKKKKLVEKMYTVLSVYVDLVSLIVFKSDLTIF